MALPFKGLWAASSADANAFAGATKWGTGANRVHSAQGEGPPLRTTGRLDGPTSQTRQLSDIPAEFDQDPVWGYTPDDMQVMGLAGMTPRWGTETSVLRSTVFSDDLPQPPWGLESPDDQMVAFRATESMDPDLWSGAKLQSFPTETVSEGWLNKTTGQTNTAETSDPVQYERQTSMQQFNPAPGRNNGAAVARGTDDPRFNIMSWAGRTTGMKLKPWSQGERNKDMFPYQQDMIVRPFRYRTAGTADPAQMAPNSMVVIAPVQRDVPSDPYLGPEETLVDSEGYGYSGEDVFF